MVKKSGKHIADTKSNTIPIKILLELKSYEVTLQNFTVDSAPWTTCG